MKRKNIKLSVLFILLLLCSGNIHAQVNNFWSVADEASVNRNQINSRFEPQQYELFELNESGLKQLLRTAPNGKNIKVSNSSLIVSFPNHLGLIEKYRVVLMPMDSALSAKYPDIRSYRGQGLDDPGSTIGFDFSPDGLHAMILSAGRETVYIDPLQSVNKTYIIYSRSAIKDSVPKFNCKTPDKAGPPSSNSSSARNADDGKLRTYKLALACTGEYGQFVIKPTDITIHQKKARVLGRMNTMRNRINMIYERDFSVHLDLISNNDTLIFLDPSADLWSGEYNVRTQIVIDSLVGNPNYNIGHLITQGGNKGNAGCVGCVCKPWNGSYDVAGENFIGKGGGYTSHLNPESGDPFVVDYVAHEMGHQFGANHTFTHESQRVTATQNEPGSGSTIMGYAGITGSNTDVQANSDDYFHASSIEQVTNYIKSGTGSCAAISSTGNSIPTASAGADYKIPKSTPFTLKGKASDANTSDVLSYTWEQMDPGGPSTTIPNATSASGPLFRSRLSVKEERIFPALESILDGTNRSKWEVLPSVSRTLKFRFTVRDNHTGGGANSSDDVEIDISGSSGPFAVTVANSPVTWTANSCQLIKWDVANTDSWFTVNCKFVKISFSPDGGKTFYELIASTENDGEESIQVPTVTSSTCRIKVEAVGNIFFDINDADINVSGTSNLSFSVATTGVTGCGKSDGKAVITISGAPPGAVYEYAVDGNFSNSPSFENLAMGNHTAIIRDKSSKCELSKDFTIGGFSTLNVSISGTGFRTFCAFQSSTATLTATASGGSGTYAYSWLGGVKTVSSSGWYSVTVTDAVTGCTKTTGGFVMFVPVICSFDPNDIIGPVGYGPGKMVSKFDQWPYMIRFENDPDFATAPAQVVKITHPLDSNLNPLSFRLGNFGFGGFAFSVPENKTYYSTRLDVMDSLGVMVDVTAGIDITKKEAFWIFEAKNPATGLPPSDATLGFLPVNDTITRKGEGFVTYTIKPANHTQTGDSVHAAASIVFDINAPIATPKIFNTIDAVSPASKVSPMPAVSDTNVFAVSWSGRDDVGGSGVKFYDLYVSENGGAYKEHQTGITDTSTTFTGLFGATYDFFTRATDNTGNKEAIKTISELKVTVRSNLVKPYLGTDTVVYKCPGDFVNLNSLFDLSGLYPVWNTPTDTAQVTPGSFTLIANNSNGLKDSAVVIVVDRQKPDLGSDTTVGYCLGSFVNLRNIINTTSYTTALWSVPDPDSVGAGAYSLVVSNAFGCRDTAIVTVTVNPKPDLGNDTTVAVCSGSTINLKNLYDLSVYSSVEWSTQKPDSVTAGIYMLTVTNATGCKDTVTITVTASPKPDLGADKAITVSCVGGTADISALYNTSGFASVVYSAPNPTAVNPGNYVLIVTTTAGCKDTATITVTDASITTVGSIGQTLLIANRECTDTSGWTHYYHDNGTASDFSDDTRLLSVKKNGNNIGTVGDSTFELKVGATAGAGSGNAVVVNNTLVPGGTKFFSMNRYWNMIPTQQPSSPVHIRFYYNTHDLTDVKGSHPSAGQLTHTQLSIYKLTGGNPDPTSNWAGATQVDYYQHSSTPTLAAWVYTALDSSGHQAEFLVSNFSGGGAGAKSNVALPVTYLTFNLIQEKDRIRVLWNTASEADSKHFLVQRSLDGNNFETIATIAAAGNSSVIKNYGYDDYTAVQYKGRIVFYRLYQVDLSNQGKYTEVKSVRIPNTLNKLTLLYNPVRQEAILKYDCAEKDEVRIHIIDQVGRVVMERTVSVIAGINQINLNTGSFASGIYEVELSSAKDHQKVRMMKE